MIDIHSHIIPGVDDGPREIGETIEMLKIAEDDGIQSIVATPHFFKGEYELTYEEIKERVRYLNIIASENEIDIKVFPGQEILLDEYTLEAYQRGQLGGIHDSGYYLFELKNDRYDATISNTLYEFTCRGIKPIIAHPERCKYISRDFAFMNKLIDDGCSFQLNIGSLEGKFGKNAKKCAEYFLNEGIYNFIGSDAHDARRRYPILRRRIMNQKRKFIEKLLLISENNKSLLNHELVKEDLKKIQRKETFFFIKK